jgi:hypothetical protein
MKKIIEFLRIIKIFLKNTKGKLKPKINKTWNLKFNCKF